MEPRWLDGPTAEDAETPTCGGCSSLTVHPFTPSLIHNITPSSQHTRWDTKGDMRLPCRTNFSRGDFAATTVAKTDNKTRGFIFQANAELLENRGVFLSFLFLTAADPSLRWCVPDSAAGPGPLSARLRSAGGVGVSGSTSEAGGSGGGGERGCSPGT